MTFTKAKPYTARSFSNDVSATLRVLKNNRKVVNLNFTKAAQIDLWEKSIIGQKFNIEIGRGDHQGLIRILEDDNGEFEVKKLPHGAARVVIEGWDLLPNEPSKAQPCVVLEPDSGMIFKLPSWAHLKDKTMRA